MPPTRPPINTDGMPRTCCRSYYYKLRHTFASILVAIGKDPTYVMQQLGDTDPAFTPCVYAHAMRRSEEEREQLKALVEGDDWAQIGHPGRPNRPSAAVEHDTD